MMTTNESMNSLCAVDPDGRRPCRDKRAAGDRRVQDAGPPAHLGERRVRAERRFPEVLYAEFDECITIPPVRRPRAGGGETLRRQK